jgi:hypothetical protein
MARYSGSPEVKAIARLSGPDAEAAIGRPGLFVPHDRYQLRAVTPANDELAAEAVRKQQRTAVPTTSKS